jgi:DNA-binding response OmpR family regulator
MDAEKTIIVVDDDPDVPIIVKGILNSEPYKVQCVSSGEELFFRLKGGRPDLILLDVKMPEMDGFEALKRLKAAPETSSIPVILLTGKGQYQDMLTGYRLGTDYYMTKPFSGAQLINGVHLFLSGENTQKAVSEAIR